MRAITAPDLDPQKVYLSCINSISDNDLRNRLNEVSNGIIIAAVNYKERAETNQLYTIPPNNCGNDTVVLGTVTKKELKNLYSSHMVGRTKPARLVYDLLLSKAPLGKCPFCGVGHASTLDHYLPKTKYPQLSVVPLNLVPSCKDCNTGKSVAIATTEEEQSLHPYFDHQKFINEQWLFAEVVPTTPETIRYFVKSPVSWDNVSKNRVKSHFNDFKLAAKYTVEAANELAGRKQILDDFKKQNDSNALINFLKQEAVSHSKKHVNSWQTALYQALAVLYSEVKNGSVSNERYICPVCEGEGVLVNKDCPLCKMECTISKDSLNYYNNNLSDFESFPCPKCNMNNNVGCDLCGGSNIISKEEALKLAKNRP